MNIGRYLPSSQFIVIVGSIALSGGLVLAAQQITHPQTEVASLTPAEMQTDLTVGVDWMKTLREIEGESVLATTSATAESTQTLLNAATSNNLTDTVARTLLVSLANEKSQGLGSDIPTQDRLIAEASAQIKKDRGTPTYVEKDLSLTVDTDLALKEYGNAVIETVAAHPDASYAGVLYGIGKLTGGTTSEGASLLTKTQKNYKALALDLLKVPVPPKLRVFHLQIANNLAAMGDSLTDIQMLYADPLRGLGGFEFYEGLNNETTRLFTNIAQQLSEDGILFSTSEPGSEWNSFLSS